MGTYLATCALSAAAAALVIVLVMTAMVGSGISDELQFAICGAIGFLAGLVVRAVA